MLNKESHSYNMFGKKFRVTYTNASLKVWQQPYLKNFASSFKKDDDMFMFGDLLGLPNMIPTEEIEKDIANATKKLKESNEELENSMNELYAKNFNVLTEGAIANKLDFIERKEDGREKIVFNTADWEGFINMWSDLIYSNVAIGFVGLGVGALYACGNAVVGSASQIAVEKTFEAGANICKNVKPEVIIDAVKDIISSPSINNLDSDIFMNCINSKQFHILKDVTDLCVLLINK